MTSTPASIWSRRRYAHDGTTPRALHPRPAHPPAVAGPPRTLAGRRGMALPVLVGGIPAADPGAAHAGRRGPPRPDHPGYDTGGHRTTGRPVLPRRHAPLAGELAAARASGHRFFVGVVARLRNSRARRGRASARRLHRALAARRRPAAARTHRRPAPSNCSVARWRTRSSRCWRRGCASSRCARAWPTRGSGSPTPRPASGHPSAPTPPAWNTAMPTPASGISWSTVRRCTATPRWAARSATPTSWRSGGIFRSATGSGRRSPVTRGTPPTATSTPTTTRRDSNRPASPDAMWRPTTRRRTTPQRADAAVDAHVADFVEVVRRRLLAESDRIGRPAHVVAAFDTELFGHWWYEGPMWLERVLRALPEAGIEVGTLSDAVARGYHRCTGRIAAQLLGFRQGLAGVVGRTGGRPGAAEHRGRRHRVVDRGQGAGTGGRCTVPRISSPTRSCARRC